MPSSAGCGNRTIALLLRSGCPNRSSCMSFVDRFQDPPGGLELLLTGVKMSTAHLEVRHPEHVMNDSTLHHAIISSFLERQRAPTLREIASRFRCDEGDVRRALRSLAENH